jgi:hypothetical protein
MKARLGMFVLKKLPRECWFTPCCDYTVANSNVFLMIVLKTNERK